MIRRSTSAHTLRSSRCDATATFRAILAWAMLLSLCACATAPPKQPNDACAIFEEKRAWFKAAKRAASRWDTHVPIILAFIKQESSFRAHAKPPRQGSFLWVFPGSRASSAYGYSQALDGTWRDYQEATGNRWAERDNFADAVDFIGWYNAQSHQRNGIARDDAYNLYLAYHEGQGGFARGSYRDKRQLQRIARRVATQADRYAAQYARCKQALERPWFKRLF